MRLCQEESPSAGKSVKIVVKLFSACTFEFGLHFIRCDKVIVSPNQIIIVLLYFIYLF